MTLMTLQDASHAVRLSESSLRRLVKAGEIEAVKVRGRYRIKEKALKDWLAGQAARRRDDKGPELDHAERA